MDVKEKIINYCNSLGLDTIGFTNCRPFYELIDFYKLRKENGLENEFEESDIEKRINPNHYMEEGKTIISIAFPYLHNIDYEDNGFSVYTRGLDYHNVVKSYLNKIAIYIETLGGKAMTFVDSNTLPERYIAYLSGVGFIGKNNMIITEKYGSYVFLGEIITDLKLYVDSDKSFSKISEFTKCGQCNLCYNECPTKSINQYKKNCNICMSYITQKKDIDDKFLKIMNGRVFGCDTCQSCCPYNRDKGFSKISDFKPLDFVETMSMDDILEMDNKIFKETFKNTSCGWRGKNTLIRNTLIRKAIFKKEDISSYKFQSPFVKEYQNRLLK